MPQVEANLVENLECHGRLNLSEVHCVTVELEIDPGGCSAEGRPEPESDVDQEDEGDQTPDFLLL